MTPRRADLLAAGAFGALAVVFLWQGRNLSFTTGQGVPGAGFFPLLMAGATLAMALALAVQALRRTGATVSQDEGVVPADSTALMDKTGVAPGPAAEVLTPMDNEEPASQLRTGLVFVLILCCALLLPVLGFVPAMLLLSCGIMFGVERRLDLVSVVSAVLLPLLTYGLFGLLLDVRLPTGLLG